MKLYGNRRLLMGNIMLFFNSALLKRTDESPSNVARLSICSGKCNCQKISYVHRKCENQVIHNLLYLLVH